MKPVPRLEARTKARVASEAAEYQRKVTERAQRPGPKKGGSPNREPNARAR